MIPTSNQLELDLFPEGVIVTEGAPADWEEVGNLDADQEPIQEPNHAHL